MDSIVNVLDEPKTFHAFAPEWNPLFWNLADHTPESLLQTGEDYLQVLAVIRAQGFEGVAFAAVFAEALKHLQDLHLRDPVRWFDLARMILSWAYWRRPADEHATLMDAARQADSTQQKEIDTMYSHRLGPTLADLAIAKARGEDLIDFLQHRFGTVPEDLARRIRAIDDPDRLREALKQSWELEKLEDLQL